MYGNELSKALGCAFIIIAGIAIGIGFLIGLIF